MQGINAEDYVNALVSWVFIKTQSNLLPESRALTMLKGTGGIIQIARLSGNAGLAVVHEFDPASVESLLQIESKIHDALGSDLVEFRPIPCP